MPERTNGTASKAVEVFGPPWVRIPLLPPENRRLRVALEASLSDTSCRRLVP